MWRTREGEEQRWRVERKGEDRGEGDGVKDSSGGLSALLQLSNPCALSTWV